MIAHDRTRLTTRLGQGQYHHTPVMLPEAMAFLRPERGGVYFDCTCGEGGHSEAILKASLNSKTVCMDLDLNMLMVAKERFKEFEGRTWFVHTNFADIDKAASLANVANSDGILMDLGISMAHLKGEKRGITFMEDQPLDMRLDVNRGEPAHSILLRIKFEELASAISEYGEERFAGKIARAIINAREKEPINTTGQLVKIISSVVPRSGRINPATRTFQALRILVNQELESLEEAIPKCLDMLGWDGTLVVISYHSLEDRIVKNAFKNAADKGFEILTKKPLCPSEEEIEANPASRSAKMRAIRRKGG